LLVDFGDLRTDLGLDQVPHYSTLCKAAKRLLKKASSPESVGEFWLGEVTEAVI